MRLVRLALLFAVALAAPASAQPTTARQAGETPAPPPPEAPAVPGRLEATVRDAATGETLPGATAQVLGQRGGASADRDGRLSLDLPSVPDTVLVRFVGYAGAQVVIMPADLVGGVARRDIRLSPAPYVLGEVTVTDEPPGEVLWRRVLARRQRLAAGLGAYAAEGYARFLLTRDGVTDVRPVPILLTETVSNLSWTRGGGLREEVVARRRRPDGGPFRWARVGPLADLYFEDALLLDGRVYPSPTRADALRNYAFRLGETVEADGRRYLDLAVIPRRVGLLAGRIRIVDTLLVIAEADLRADPGPRGGPVDDFDARYRWSYAPAWTNDALADSVWLPRRFDREGQVTVNLPGNRVPRVRFRQTTVLELVVPGVRGQAADLGRRYLNPRGVYAGYEIFRTGRSRLPLDSLETVAWESETVRRARLADLLRRQEGIGLSVFGLALSKLSGTDVEGEDD